MIGYVSTWHELVCPECQARNFVYAGDLNDMTGFDPENCKCWNCGHCFDFDGEPVDEDECCDEGKNFTEDLSKSNKNV